MDETQARRLVDTYADMILRISYSYLKQTYDAEDICQSVLLKYLSQEPEFDSDAHEKAWMIRTTVNACKDHLKSAFFRKRADAEAVDDLPAQQPAPQTELLEALETLPANYRISIYLHYYEGYSIREIAAMLKKSESAVAAWLSRGRKRLRKCLGDETTYGGNEA